MKILVIDDNKTNRDLAQAQLASEELTVVGSYEQAQEILSEPHSFEVVLTDLLMPPPVEQQAKRSGWGELPVGIFLGLLAAKNGAKLVAVFTDSNHHEHPASECFDAFNSGPGMPPIQVENARLYLCNDRAAIGDFAQGDLAKRLSYHEAKQGGLHVHGKDWRRVLDYALGKRDSLYG